MTSREGGQEQVADWLVTLGASLERETICERTAEAITALFPGVDALLLGKPSHRALVLDGKLTPLTAPLRMLSTRPLGATPELVGAWLLVELRCEDQIYGRLALRHAERLADDWRLRVLASAFAHALHRAEQHADVRAREAQVWSILDNIKSVVFIKDLEGRYTLINHQLILDTGLTREQVIGKRDEELFSTEVAARITADDRQVLDSGELGEFEGVADFPTGPRVFFTTKFPLRDRSGEIYGLCGISTDVSARKRAQRAEQLDALGRLAGGVAHDFNNVLVGIVGSSEVIDDLMPAPRPAKLDEALATISSSCERATELTKRLLLFSREAHRPRELIDLHALIDDAAALLRSGEAKAEIHTRLEAREAAVFGDLTQLRSAVLQLGLNARDALVEGRGRIEFITRELTLDEHICNESPFALQPGPYVELEVRDTGRGIDAHVLPRIFEPFFTTKSAGEGTGLGLVTAHGAAVNHGGALEVRKRSGPGTSMVLRLPQAPTPAERPAPTLDAAPAPVPVPAPAPVRPATSEPRASGPMQVLLADDEPMVRRTLKTQLLTFGLEVIEAEDGEQAVEAFKQHHEQLSAVVLDMLMPKLGGAEAFVRMRAIDPTVPVIVCTGYAPEEDIRGLKRQGLAGFIAKPYRRRKLRKELEAVLGPLESRPIT